MIELFVASLFLPLFPCSILLNGLLHRLKSDVARFMVLLLWPQIGVLLIQTQPVPESFAAWALFSSCFYALRMLTVRDLRLWAGFLASSALSLIWTGNVESALDMHILALWFSLPSAMLLLLAGALASRFGAAYAGLHGALEKSTPRLCALLILTLLVAIATPPFPGFFAMMGLLQRTGIVPIVLFIWLLWEWAAIRLMQGFLLGNSDAHTVEDIGKNGTLLFACFLGIIVVTSLFLTEGAP